ncbi:hypothetical protein C8R44DRAFT_773886 [Mycena epipterygia]|nr:hypothetical protein C8R44DRAFT_773886 [Mycena epipterygia]
MLLVACILLATSGDPDCGCNCKGIRRFASLVQRDVARRSWLPYRARESDAHRGGTQSPPKKLDRGSGCFMLTSFRPQLERRLSVEPPTPTWTNRQVKLWSKLDSDRSCQSGHDLTFNLILPTS